MKAGRTEEAEPLLIQGYRHLLDGQGPDTAMTQRARERLRLLYEATGRPEEAAKLTVGG
jgi:hypothetical protein